MGQINYEEVLGDLRSRRRDLDDAIRGIERLIRSGSAPLEGTGVQSSQDFSSMTTTDAIKHYLAQVGVPKQASVIARALKSGGIETKSKNYYPIVSTALRRLRERGEVVHSRESGTWSLP